MRKSIAISLLLIYIIASSNVGVRAYYSSGQLKSINVVLDKSSEKACTNSAQTTKRMAQNKAIKSKQVVALPTTLKKVLNCMTVVSQGFFEAYDDADAAPSCNTCSAPQGKSSYPPHMLSID